MNSVPHEDKEEEGVHKSQKFTDVICVCLPAGEPLGAVCVVAHGADHHDAVLEAVERLGHCAAEATAAVDLAVSSPDHNVPVRQSERTLSIKKPRVNN